MSLTIYNLRKTIADFHLKNKPRFLIVYSAQLEFLKENLPLEKISDNHYRIIGTEIDVYVSSHTLPDTVLHNIEEIS